MAPNAFNSPVEMLDYCRPTATMSCGPKIQLAKRQSYNRRNYPSGRSSLSPSFMLHKSRPDCNPLPQECFNMNKNHRIQSATPVGKHMIASALPSQFVHSQLSKPNFSQSKRRTHSESFNYGKPAIQFTNQKPVYFNRSSKSASPVIVTSEVITPVKLPSTAFTCAELEAQANKTPLKMLTCAEVEAVPVPKSESVDQSVFSDIISTHCSSPVPSVSSMSSGYESCASDIFFADTIDSTLVEDSGDELNDSGIEDDEKKKVSKSLLALFEESYITEKVIYPTPEKNHYAPPLAPLSPLMKCPPPLQSIGDLPSGIPYKFVDNKKSPNISIQKSQSTSSVKKNSNRNASTTVKTDMKKTPVHVKNSTPVASNPKKSCRKTVSTPLPPSPVTVMPIMTSAPVALSLPSPPMQWKKVSDESSQSMENLTAGIDITQEIRALVGLTSDTLQKSSPIRVC